MKRLIISTLLLAALTLPVSASSVYEHPPSVNAQQQKQTQKAAHKAAKKQEKAQKKELKQQKKDAKKWNKSRPHTTTTTT